MNEDKKTKMKNEAVKRMEKLKIIPQIITDFMKNDKVNKSEEKGILYSLNDEEKKAVKNFEKETSSIVYTCILNHFKSGKCLSMLYVTKDEFLWNRDKEDLEDRNPSVYTYNLDNPQLSEFRTIGIVPKHGGLLRVA